MSAERAHRRRCERSWGLPRARTKTPTIAQRAVKILSDRPSIIAPQMLTTGIRLKGRHPTGANLKVRVVVTPNNYYSFSLALAE